MSAKPTSKTFGKTTREVPAPSEKAKKWYPADDDAENKKQPTTTHRLATSTHFIAASKQQPSASVANRCKSQVRKAVRSWTPRKSLQPGTVLILLAGRFRGKRVILLKSLDQGVLLVTGPFKINGVPLRRVNSRYVIATSYKVDISGLDEKKIEEISQPKYFTAEKAKEKAGEEAFFKQGEKPQKKEINSSRAADQKAIDKALIANIKKVDLLASYLASSFSLRKGDKPHEMAW
ncbi:60S ribosomal protein L6 [Fusarium sp. Ph1]|nr:60S ribosomal protein L6 [Fusarium sp. Ph1]